MEVTVHHPLYFSENCWLWAREQWLLPDQAPWLWDWHDNGQYIVLYTTGNNGKMLIKRFRVGCSQVDYFEEFNERQTFMSFCWRGKHCRYVGGTSNPTIQEQTLACAPLRTYVVK